MRRRDRTEWPGPARGADAPRREAANTGTTRIGIARPLPNSRRARRVAHGVRRKSNLVHIHKAARQPRCASISPPIVSVGHAAAPALLQLPIHGNQPDTAMRAIRGLLPSRRRMAVFRTCHPGLIGIHRPTTLGTVANGRVTTAMVEIRTGRAQGHSHLVPHACERADRSRHDAVVTLPE
jgi:hypothetical protein